MLLYHNRYNFLGYFYKFSNVKSKQSTYCKSVNSEASFFFQKLSVTNCLQNLQNGRLRAGGIRGEFDIAHYQQICFLTYEFENSFAYELLGHN